MAALNELVAPFDGRVFGFGGSNWVQRSDGGSGRKVIFKTDYPDYKANAYGCQSVEARMMIQGSWPGRGTGASDRT